LKKYYTGIGARETPEHILRLFESVGKYLANQGYILRSGGSEGADKAFENGCDLVNGKKEIYIPWFDFNGSKSRFVLNDSRAYEIAEKHHPAWGRLTQCGRKLQARNTHQVLGNHFSEPSEFLICLTKNGNGGGGTGQAIRIANAYDVLVFDCGKYDSIEEIKIELWKFLKNIKGD
jgi:hypothetical protein